MSAGSPAAEADYAGENRKYAIYVHFLTGGLSWFLERKIYFFRADSLCHPHVKSTREAPPLPLRREEWGNPRHWRRRRRCLIPPGCGAAEGGGGASLLDTAPWRGPRKGGRCATVHRGWKGRRGPKGEGGLLAKSKPLLTFKLPSTWLTSRGVDKALQVLRGNRPRRNVAALFSDTRREPWGGGRSASESKKYGNFSRPLKSTEGIDCSEWRGGSAPSLRLPMSNNIVYCT